MREGAITNKNKGLHLLWSSPLVVMYVCECLDEVHLTQHEKQTVT